MADARSTFPMPAAWVDAAVARVIRDEGLDTSDPFVARLVARLRARLDRVELTIVLKPRTPEASP